MKRIWMLVTVLTVVLALSVSVFAASATYKDVPDGKWFTKGVQYVSEKGYMSGTGKNQFTPNGTVSRAQVAQILYAMEKKPLNNQSVFKDVPKGKWYTDAVNWAGTVGLMSGYEDGTFKPSEGVTRQQLATVLYKYAKYKNLDLTPTADLSSFKDSKDVASWAKTQMSWCVASKLIAGTKKGLEPKAKVTRAQLAVILMAFDQLKPVSDKPVVTDDETPYIGENGNWWIGKKDTGVRAAGKDGETPNIGENGNWWIDGKDTGVKASAKVITTDKMEIGDKAEVLPGSSFSWTDEKGNEIVFDKVEFTLYAQDNYEELSKSRDKSFFHKVPSDSTYSIRNYWYEENYYNPYIYRIDFKGHTDKKLAGQIVEVTFNNDDNDGTFWLKALVEKDGSFRCVYYDGMYGRHFSFGRADVNEIGEGGYPELKVFDNELSTVKISYYVSNKIDNLKNITVTIKGKDINGKDLSRSMKLDEKKDNIVFEDVPSSGKDGYDLLLTGVLNQTGERKIDSMHVFPGVEIERSLGEWDLIDNREGIITIPVENKIDKSYFEDGRGISLFLNGKDINGIERGYWGHITENSKEVVFEDVVYSDSTGYSLSIDDTDSFSLTPDIKVKVNSEKTSTEKVTLQLKTYTLKVPVEASNGVRAGFKIKVSGTSRDGSTVEKIQETDETGYAIFELPCGQYDISFPELPEGYDSGTVNDSYIWLSSDYEVPPAEVHAVEE